MNVYRFALLVTPIAGAIAGVASIQRSNVQSLLLGGGSGLLLGIAIYGAALAITRLGAGIDGQQRRSQQVVSVVGVFLCIISPVLAWVIATMVVSRVLHF